MTTYQALKGLLALVFHTQNGAVISPCRDTRHYMRMKGIKSSCDLLSALKEDGWRVKEEK